MTHRTLGTDLEKDEGFTSRQHHLEEYMQQQSWTGLQLGRGRIAYVPLGSWSSRQGGSSRRVHSVAVALVAIQRRRQH
jgi:hypothetical protein